MSEEDDLTAEEMELLTNLSGGVPKQEEKQGIFSFFKRVITMDDTSRTSNLHEDELGLAKVPVRTDLQLSLFCDKMGLSGLKDYFFTEAQILTNTSLSREGFLDKLVVTQKREMETKKRMQNLQRKGLFKKKDQQFEEI